MKNLINFRNVKTEGMTLYFPEYTLEVVRKTKRPKKAYIATPCQCQDTYGHHWQGIMLSENRSDYPIKKVCSNCGKTFTIDIMVSVV